MFEASAHMHLTVECVNASPAKIYESVPKEANSLFDANLPAAVAASARGTRVGVSHAFTNLVFKDSIQSP